ncbi:MAG: Magnesium and cobalt efflux protein CorC [Candidatus Carbobacillus altaicus]|uniref:Magnesium and cobalt efflux protein CorC n=1 Tax=Candidatus Carbonibacillus altaicus TaxID=2163959 RepID=A0A2R6Y3C0_9BACL|nr:MAG: Magnesium and cobalt efflux protein CorC [Candidatus Carbobacillus altaicus]
MADALTARPVKGRSSLDDPDPTFSPFYLLWVVFFVLVNAYFVAIEFAMVRARHGRLETKAEEGDARAKAALILMNDMPRYLSAAQLGITLASLALGWLGEPAVSALIHPLFVWVHMPEELIAPISTVLGFLLITAVHIVLGEQVPKMMGIQAAETIVLWGSGLMFYFYQLTRPFIVLLNWGTQGVMKLMGMQMLSDHQSAHTEEEIRYLMRESHESGLIDQSEYDLVDNIFEFAETNAREIMIPRTEMECLYTSLSYDENIAIIKEKMHTRYPLCDPDKDHIIGLIHIKDFWRMPEERDLKQLLRPIAKVPESIPLSRLLKVMQREKTEMCILIDEYGGTAGLVTLEDVLEEIVGEIQDEFDEERPLVEAQPDGSHSVDGRMLIDDFNETFGTHIENEDYDTIGGWIYSQVEMTPRVGEKVRYQEETQELVFTVTEMEDLRILRLSVLKVPASSGETEHLDEAAW